VTRINIEADRVAVLLDTVRPEGNLKGGTLLEGTVEGNRMDIHSLVGDSSTAGEQKGVR